MQTQKDKIAVDISQIPQDALKSYDNWRFSRNLFVGLSATFIVLLFSFLIDPSHPSSPFLFAVAFGMSAALILFSLSSPRRKRYSVFLFSDEGKAFTLICTETIALFFIAASLYALFLDVAFSTSTTVQAIFIIIIMLPIAIISHNANDEFAADETVYLPQRVLKSQEKINELVADEMTNGQNLSQVQANQSDATESEPKFEGASHETEPSQSDEEAEALEYGKALAQIPENLKRRYQIHLLVRFAFVSFAAMAFLILFSSNVDKLYWAFIVSAICVGVFFASGRRYSKLFVENPEKSNTIFAIENFAIMTLVLYYPVGSLFLEGKAVHSSDAAATFVYLYLPLIPILLITSVVCLARNLSFYKEIK
jgi:putative membrane protein